MKSAVSKASGILDSLFVELRGNLELLFKEFNKEQFVLLVEELASRNGMLFFTGVGKSSIIAEKIAVTMSSTGTKAMYLSAQNALHGDIGLVGEGDTVFLLSKSGETNELLELCPALRNKGAFLIAVVSNPSSRLGLTCDKAFILPNVKELCPFDLAPTTSALSQLIFGDLLAMSIMRMKNISLQDFIQNHPAGRIGKRQLVKVRDLMITGEKKPRCSPYDKLVDVLHELSNKQCGCVCVIDENDHLLGIFTDGDLRRSIQKFGEKSLQKEMHELMTKGARTVHPDTLAYEAMRLMEDDQKRPVSVLVVEEEGHYLGLIKMHDIIQSGL